MTATNKHNHHHNNNNNDNNHQPSTSKPPKTPISNTTTTVTNPNPSTSTNPLMSLSQQDHYLSRATHLTRPELLRRRYHMCKQYSRLLRNVLWLFAEELKVQYRNYYWKYGVSPFKEDSERGKVSNFIDNETDGERKVGAFGAEGVGESKCGADFDLFKNNLRCLFVGCKLKPMALTSFCHLHILSDSKQKLYKPCGFLIKSAPAGPITCGKPILRSTTPSICSYHLPKFQKNINQALRKAGLNGSQANKLTPLFHVTVAEYVRQIQAGRRNAKRKSRNEGAEIEARGN